MSENATKERTERKTVPPITGVFYSLHQLTENNPGGYEWVIMQVTIHQGKITDVTPSQASVKEVVANRLATMLQNGETLESLR